MVYLAPRYAPSARRVQPAVGTALQAVDRTRKTVVSCINVRLLLLAVLTFLVATAVAKLTPAAVRGLLIPDFSSAPSPVGAADRQTDR